MPTIRAGRRRGPSPRFRFAGDPGRGRMRYGASHQGSDVDAAAWEATVGGPLQPFRYYHQPNDSATDVVNRARTNIDTYGRLPFVSLKLPGTWASVAVGDHDAWLTGIATGLATLTAPVWLTLHHEPYGNGPAADFRAMYAHVVPLMRGHDGGNVAYGPVLNGSQFEFDPPGMAAYIPDEAHMDWFGFDLYNAWWPTGGNWRTWGDRMSFIEPHIPAGTPRVVGEYGCREDPTDPQRAAEWLADMYDYCLARNFAGICYFNSGANSPEGTWQLDGAREQQWIANLNRPTTARL